MQRLITPDQCYCSFGDGIVYEFISDNNVQRENQCSQCSFRWHFPFFAGSERCFSVPCQNINSKDKNGGFWRVSDSVDYQAFEKMLKNGG